MVFLIRLMDFVAEEQHLMAAGYQNLEMVVE
jgi:hypothetical protein